MNTVGLQDAGRPQRSLRSKRHDDFRLCGSSRDWRRMAIHFVPRDAARIDDCGPRRIIVFESDPANFRFFLAV